MATSSTDHRIPGCAHPANLIFLGSGCHEAETDVAALCRTSVLGGCNGNRSRNETGVI